ncbi:MAG: ATP-dependent DNA helicase, partial [Halanaerobiales bacterium]
YSADLYLSHFLQLKSRLEVEKSYSLNKRVIRYLDRIISFLLDYNSEIAVKQKDEDFILQQELDLELYPIFNGFINKAEEWLLENNEDNKAKNQESVLYQLLLDAYFNVLAFLRIMDIYDDNFISYYQQEEEKIELNYNTEEHLKNLFGNIDGQSKEGQTKDIKVKLFCLDPAKNLKEVVKKGKASVFFSATLSPLDYYQKILAGEDDYYLQLPSPFAKENLCLLLADNISTKYRERESGYDRIVEYIYTVITCKKGNYLVFFPSYAYMERVYELFVEKYSAINTLVQSRNMTEDDRKNFLKSFDSNIDNYLAFAVTGGIFSEGIDLKGKKLLGTIVVGIAHPQITLERNLIRDYFQAEVNKGYEYAYIYPGINKILQAAGRTIRSSTDRGVVFLIGARYENYRYSNLLPAYWHQIKKKVYSSDDILKILNDFWAR